jgi:hypothetical protein
MSNLPFDEVAFRNGAVAISVGGVETEFGGIGTGNVLLVRRLSDGEEMSFSRSHLISNWSMKPQPADADGWIGVVDGKCPMVAKDWKPMEFEWRDTSGEVFLSYSRGLSLRYELGTIVAVRLIKKSQEKPVEDGMQVISEKEVKELQERLLPVRKSLPPPILPISQNEVMRIAGEAMRDAVKPGPVVKCDAISRLMR